MYYHPVHKEGNLINTASWPSLTSLADDAKYTLGVVGPTIWLAVVMKGHRKMDSNQWRPPLLEAGALTTIASELMKYITLLEAVFNICLLIADKLSIQRLNKSAENGYTLVSLPLIYNSSEWNFIVHIKQYTDVVDTFSLAVQIRVPVDDVLRCTPDL